MYLLSGSKLILISGEYKIKIHYLNLMNAWWFWVKNLIILKIYFDHINNGKQNLCFINYFIGEREIFSFHYF